MRRRMLKAWFLLASVLTVGTGLTAFESRTLGCSTTPREDTAGSCCVQDTAPSPACHCCGTDATPAAGPAQQDTARDHSPAVSRGRSTHPGRQSSTAGSCVCQGRGPSAPEPRPQPSAPEHSRLAFQADQPGAVAHPPRHHALATHTLRVLDPGLPVYLRTSRLLI